MDQGKFEVFISRYCEISGIDPLKVNIFVVKYIKKIYLLYQIKVGAMRYNLLNNKKKINIKSIFLVQII